MKIGICGNGTMGNVVEKMISEKIASGVEIEFCGMYNPLGEEGIEQAFSMLPDVIIDFSNPAAINDLCGYAEQNGIALVIATTGCGEEEVARIHIASESVPVVFSANYSLGVIVLEKVVAELEQILGADYDIEIIEKHHNKKADSPSGTALLLANAINSTGKYEFTHGRLGSSKRTKTEIGIHAVRGGSIVGEHAVIFAGDDEVIELWHRAGSKKIFATGALKAASFVAGKAPALYNMRDILFGAE